MFEPDGPEERTAYNDELAETLDAFDYYHEDADMQNDIEWCEEHAS